MGEMGLAPDFIENLLREEESSVLDFKRDQYPFRLANNEEKSELLKDILAFANAWRHAPAYILIGVREIKGGRSEIVGISEHLEDANVQEFVNKKTQRPITFSYTAQEFEGKLIGVITIPVQDRPFYLKQDFGPLKANAVYIRRGTSTDIAKPDEIAKMGSVPLSVESIAREPVLNIAFVNCEGTLLDRICVPCYVPIQLEAEREKIIKNLESLKISNEDIEIVKRRAKDLDEIFEYLPDGSEYKPFKASRVMSFKSKIDEAFKIANENFEEMEKRIGSFHRTGLLTCEEVPSHRGMTFNMELVISNDGTCPAENIHVYIDSTDSVKFFSMEELLMFDLDLEFPKDIRETLRVAKMNDSERKAIRLQYLQKRQSKYSLRDAVRSWPSITTMEDIINPRPTITLESGQLEIHIPKALMHNHKRSFKSWKVYICASVRKGQLAEVPYICHANNLARPSRGVLIFEGV